MRRRRIPVVVEPHTLQFFSGREPGRLISYIPCSPLLLLFPMQVSPGSWSSEARSGNQPLHYGPTEFHIIATNGMQAPDQDGYSDTRHAERRRYIRAALRDCIRISRLQELACYSRDAKATASRPIADAHPDGPPQRQPAS